MAQGWQAVARAINARLSELGLSQRELVARSQVSRATVAEIQHNTAQRRRSDRTLEALSTALDWHPGHLAAVLAGKRPPKLAEPVVRGDEDVPGRLAAIEHQLREITEKLDGLGIVSDEINTNVANVVERFSERRKPGR
ncbi:helix-turn-helix domain-containing protein [Sciscionella marina]|uniref:helix-turn-helix domain-containing protein n=1 Tax=Sciscionella marina TaxID=508770 RepID=UPI000361ACCA|nr:transcriptional regulator [Sciscionella marina]